MQRLGLSPHQQNGRFQNWCSEEEDAVLDADKHTNGTDAIGIRKPVEIRGAPGSIHHH